MTTPKVTLLYNKLIDAINVAMIGLVEHQSGAAKVFQPVPRQSIGSADAELELLRYAVGAWGRTAEPYKAASVNLPQYLAFAYCAERALLADGRDELASVFAFIRSMKEPSNVVAGYPSKGGLSRILEWHRRGPASWPVQCTEEMLRMEHAVDAVAFARSEMFPVGRWADGWTSVDKVVREARPMNAAHRATIKLKQVAGGLLGAGQQFVEAKASGVVLAGANLDGANLGGANLSGANLSGANLGGASLLYAKLGGANLRDANLGGASLLYADLRDANFVGADIRDAYLTGARLIGANLIGSYLTGSDLIGAYRDPGDPPIPGWTLVNGRLQPRS